MPPSTTQAMIEATTMLGNQRSRLNWNAGAVRAAAAGKAMIVEKPLTGFFGPPGADAEQLVRHPGVDKISFTGGTATARRILQPLPLWHPGAGAGEAGGAHAPACGATDAHGGAATGPAAGVAGLPVGSRGTAWSGGRSLIG